MFFQLPLSLCEMDCVETFQYHLKTKLFVDAYYVSDYLTSSQKCQTMIFLKFYYFTLFYSVQRRCPSFYTSSCCDCDWLVVLLRVMKSNGNHVLSHKLLSHFADLHWLTLYWNCWFAVAGDVMRMLSSSPIWPRWG